MYVCFVELITRYHTGLEDTMPIIMIMEGTPPLRGEPYPTF
jgi:hypothetical protein